MIDPFLCFFTEDTLRIGLNYDRIYYILISNGYR